ncbi:MAG: Gfo/Idh/MocA family oxidoreductase [Anditalea sp.]
MKKVKWGVLGASKIAIEKVIPAMADHEQFQVTAIASRNMEKAKAAAEKLNIQKFYGSYEELIQDPEIDVVYIPLPNDLHVSFTLKCIEAGKHVLCEKPLALKADDIERLIRARDKHKVKVGEAFMVKSHPQWIKAREIVQQGGLGKVCLIHGFFSYHNTKPENIRNKPEHGGGAIWDIGCYPVFTSRYVLGEEPVRVVASMEYDKEFGTDKMASVILQFPSARVVFSVSTQLVPYQRMSFFGEKKELEVRIPFNAPPDRPCEIRINPGDVFNESYDTLTFEACNQYTLQAEAFTKAVIEDTEVPVSLENARANAKVLEAIFLSAKEGRWVDLD